MEGGKSRSFCQEGEHYSLAMGEEYMKRTLGQHPYLRTIFATFPGFCRRSFACPADPSHIHAAPAAESSYKPLFFSPEQYRLIEHIAEIVIPVDDSPGAKDAGVSEFIDFMVANRVAVSPRGEIRSTADAIRQVDDAQARFVGGELISHWEKVLVLLVENSQKLTSSILTAKAKEAMVFSRGEF